MSQVQALKMISKRSKSDRKSKRKHTDEDGSKLQITKARNECSYVRLDTLNLMPTGNDLSYFTHNYFVLVM